MVATSLALAVMIGGIQRVSLPSILPYVMAGIMSFALSGIYILSEAPEVFMSSSNIIKNHAYPYTYYSFESLTRTFIIFLHNLVVFFIAMALIQALTLPNWTVIPALLVVYANSLVWGGLASMVAARFRDLRFMLPFCQQIIFFLTPVFWKPDNMGDWRSLLIAFNPFYGLVEIIRSPLLGHAASQLAWMQASCSLLLGSVLWLTVFSIFRKKIAFWI